MESFDTDTHRYYREVIWPRQRQLRAEEEATAQEEEQSVAEETARYKRSRIDGYKLKGASALRHEIEAGEKYIESLNRSIAYTEETVEGLRTAQNELE